MTRRLNILFVTPMCSSAFVTDLYNKSGKNPGFSLQKFSRLLSLGFNANDANITALSLRPISKQNSSKIFWGKKIEEENSIRYHYVPFLNVNILRHICLFLYSFFYVFGWGIKNKKSGAVICDVLSISACMGSLLACKIMGIPNVGLMTDMPGLMMSSRKDSLATKLNKSYISSFSSYVFLTEQMNGVINVKKRPYIVMEGLVDDSMRMEETKCEKNVPRTILYAGGLHERYGLKMLVDGFIQAEIPNSQLLVYGSGPYAGELEQVCKTNPNVVFKGVADNSTVVDSEMRATLLVNPRPTHEDFTKYSFPSKNMEYMVSGTPLLTTKLPGMPSEYYPYVYLFEQETTDGYASKLMEVMSQDETALSEKGTAAKEFVLDRKNNVAQASRVLGLVKEIINN